jgi:hypothetical protein
VLGAVTFLALDDGESFLGRVLLACFDSPVLLAGLVAGEGRFALGDGDEHEGAGEYVEGDDEGGGIAVAEEEARSGVVVADERATAGEGNGDADGEAEKKVVMPPLGFSVD